MRKCLVPLAAAAALAAQPEAVGAGFALEIGGGDAGAPVVRPSVAAGGTPGRAAGPGAPR